MGKLIRVLLAATAAVAVGAAGAWAGTVTLGAYSFDDRLFGDSLVEHDGGAHSAANWLNVDKVNPGNPGYLTGANFDTGVANMGIGSLSSPWKPSIQVSYDIFYDTAIANGAGADLAVVVFRGSTDPKYWDNFYLSVSTDGTSFGAAQWFGKYGAVSTGVQKTYWYMARGEDVNGGLWVHLIDLDAFGVGAGAGARAVRITSDAPIVQPELDLIRVAGFRPVPEPATGLLLGSGLALLAAWGRRRRG